MVSEDMVVAGQETQILDSAELGQTSAHWEIPEQEHRS